MKLSFKWGRSVGQKRISVFAEECLTRDEADKIKKLDVQELLEASSGERTKRFRSLIGNKAEWLNSKFETEYVLKNQQNGLLNWINNRTGVQDKFRKDIIRRINELSHALSPEEEEEFLQTLAKLALGVGTTKEEEEKISDLCKKAAEAREHGSQEEYERAQCALDAYIEELKGF